MLCAFVDVVRRDSKETRDEINDMSMLLHMIWE